MIQCILFDVDGTLADSFNANATFLQDIVRAAGYPIPTKETYRPFFHFTRRNALRALLPTVSESEIDRVMQLSHDVPYPVHLIHTPQDNVSVVKSLASQYVIGIVTSKMRKTNESYLEHAGLRDVFKIVVVHEDTAKHKPDPEPLLFAALKLGLLPDSCVYVGDMHTDIEAANACGMKAIAYSQTSILGAHAHIDSFLELPDIISKLSTAEH